MATRDPRGDHLGETAACTGLPGGKRPAANRSLGHQREPQDEAGVSTGDAGAGDPSEEGSDGTPHSSKADMMGKPIAPQPPELPPLPRNAVRACVWHEGCLLEKQTKRREYLEKTDKPSHSHVLPWTSPRAASRAGTGARQGARPGSPPGAHRGARRGAHQEPASCPPRARPQLLRTRQNPAKQPLPARLSAALSTYVRGRA